jgi:hypothetical protein
MLESATLQNEAGRRSDASRRSLLQIEANQPGAGYYKTNRNRFARTPRSRRPGRPASMAPPICKTKPKPSRDERGCANRQFYKTKPVADLMPLTGDHTNRSQSARTPPTRAECIFIRSRWARRGRALPTIRTQSRGFDKTKPFSRRPGGGVICKNEAAGAAGFRRS